MKKPRQQPKATSSRKSFTEKYRIGNGGDIDKIPEAELGICECERYCQGGKIVSGATFRKHYSRSVVRTAEDQPDERKRPGRPYVSSGIQPSGCHLLENLTKIPEPSIPILLDWFREQGIWIHESLEIRSMAGGRGIAVYAVGVGSPQQVVCKIPRAAILSSKTTPFMSLMPRKTLKQIPPIVMLSLSLLYEFRLGPESRYWGYLQSLPRSHVPIVSLWDIDYVGGEDGKGARETVKGTAVEAELKRIKKDGHSLEELYLYLQATVDAFPLTSFSPAPPSQLDLLYTYSLVSSRAFQVDVYHGAAIVPLADAFNHQELNNVCFESDDFVCEACGSLATCEHDDIEGVEPRWPREEEATADTETINIASRLSHLPLEVIRSLFDPQQNTLDLTVKTPFEPGQEVFNTYGEGMGWAKQACEWGFIDESIEGDGALGKGLRWELTEVFSRDADDYDSIKGEWKRQCKQDQSEISVDSSSRENLRKSLSDVERDSLFFSPAASDSAKDTLLLNEDGQLSLPLFWGIVCSAECAIRDKRAIARILDKIYQGPQSEDDVTQHGKSESRATTKDTSVLQRIVSRVIDLCKQRVGKTRYADRTTSDLCDLLDDLYPTNRNLSRIGLKILISERRVLEAVITRWTDIQVALQSP
ncbi:hypothetical protein NliqN6_0374 [Naganishia liquefaciens]|uniref:SET domain-containing protein n=1 Tax=Naganishia liquefaciens TaxID=104408 RepID=A0A8H3TMR8_9TREE|nr:hypothetical protein NliqN6_0374 [Naganishia liquefaciens]